MKIPLKHEQATPLQELTGSELPEKPSPGSASAPPSPKAAAGASPSAGQSPEASAKGEATGDRSEGRPESKTPSLDALKGTEFVTVAPPSELKAREDGTDPRVQAKGVSAIRAQSGAKAAVDQKAAPSFDLLATFRVRTARGLTYDFSTREAMDKWLIGREDLAGCEVAEPDGAWMPAEQYRRSRSLLPATPPAEERDGSVPLTDNLDLGRPSPGKASSYAFTKEDEPAEGSAPVSIAPGEPVQAAAKAALAHLQPVGVPRGMSPRRMDGLALVLSVLSVLTTLVMLLAVGATLTRYGVMDLSTVLPLSAVGIEYPGKAGERPDQPDLEAIEQQDPEAVYRKALLAAKRSLRAKRFSKAALEYKRALTVHPGSVEALEGLASAYNGLGDRDRAVETMKKAKSIDGK